MAQQDAARLRHPNRERASAQATKAVISILLVASATLIAVVLIAGWTVQQGARWMTLSYVILYAIIAYFVFFKWKRGILAMAAALALMFAAMTAPGLPGWFERAKDGYAVSLLPPSILGLLTVLIVVLQVLLVVASILGFQQGWDLEVEERSDEDHEDEYEEDHHEGDASENGHHGHEDGDGEYDHGEDRTTEQQAVGSPAAGGSSAAGAGDGHSESGSGASTHAEVEHGRATDAEDEAGDGAGRRPPWAQS